MVCGCRFAVRTGGRWPDLSGGALGVAGASEITMPPSGNAFKTRANESGAAPLHLGIRFISELQLEDIIRYACDCQKCDIALSTIPLRTFGVASTAPLPVRLRT